MTLHFYKLFLQLLLQFSLDGMQKVMFIQHMVQSIMMLLPTYHGGRHDSFSIPSVQMLQICILECFFLCCRHTRVTEPTLSWLTSKTFEIYSLALLPHHWSKTKNLYRCQWSCFVLTKGALQPWQHCAVCFPWGIRAIIATCFSCHYEWLSLDSNPEPVGFKSSYT